MKNDFFNTRTIRFTRTYLKKQLESISHESKINHFYFRRELTTVYNPYINNRINFFYIEKTYTDKCEENYSIHKNDFDCYISTRTIFLLQKRQELLFKLADQTIKRFNYIQKNNQEYMDVIETSHKWINF